MIQEEKANTYDEALIEIPFGAKDSELQEFEYIIPKDYGAEIKDSHRIVKKWRKEYERQECLKEKELIRKRLLNEKS